MGHFFALYLGPEVWYVNVMLIAHTIGRGYVYMLCSNYHDNVILISKFPIMVVNWLPTYTVVVSVMHIIVAIRYQLRIVVIVFVTTHIPITKCVRSRLCAIAVKVIGLLTSHSEHTRPGM